MTEVYLIPFKYNNDPILFKEKIVERICDNSFNKKYNSHTDDFYIISITFNSNTIEEDVEYLKHIGNKILEYK